MTLISIVVPYYNRLECLAKLIDSVKAQTYSNWELIIVDDCSTDSVKAQEIIEQSNESRIIYHRHEVNKNGAQARNTGIDLSKGEYIAFLDSDDLWFPDKLEVQLQQISQCKQPENTILYGALEKIYQDGSKPTQILPISPKLDEDSVSDYLFAQNGLMQTSTFFLSKQLTEKIRFNPRLPRHQDYDFILKAEHCGVHFSYTKEPVGQWIVLSGDSNVVRKGASLAFAMLWFEEYQQYMTQSGALVYLSKQMFYIAYKNKSLWKYYLFIINKYGIKKLLNILFINLKFVMGDN